MPATPGRPAKFQREYRWADYDDEALLCLRFKSLGLTLKGSPLWLDVERLYAELERRGLRFRPHVWLSTEWFSPDGIPGFAIPFYLAHPRLRRLERRMMGEVEGGARKWRMRILRHEAGHAIDNAYGLRRRADFQRVFGRASKAYPDDYSPRPSSDRHVLHLGHWYAQSHPVEDFAETFAVWMQPKASWRRDYAGWPAHELNLRDNALDSLKEALAKFEQGDGGDLKAYKFAVQHMSHFVELIFKHHLASIHPLLIYKDPFSRKLNADKTIGLWDAINFIANESPELPSFPASQRPSVPASQRPSFPASQRPSFPGFQRSSVGRGPLGLCRNQGIPIPSPPAIDPLSP